MSVKKNITTSRFSDDLKIINFFFYAYCHRDFSVYCVYIIILFTVMWAHELRSSQLSFLTRLGMASLGQWGTLENLLTGLGVAVVVVVEEPAGDRPPPPPPLGTCGGAGAGNLCLDRGSVCCAGPVLARLFPAVVPGNILVSVDENRENTTFRRDLPAGRRRYRVGRDQVSIITRAGGKRI